MAGFWSGLWHGVVCPIAFVTSLFRRDISIYEVHNNGGWYNLGFVFGAGAWGLLRWGGSGARSRQGSGGLGTIGLQDFTDEELLEEVEERGLGRDEATGLETLDDDSR